MIQLIFGIILSYLLGSVPTAYLVAKHWGGIDIREHGSGNVGATNALRVPGIIVLLLDILKGVLAVTLFSLLISPELVTLEIVKASFGLAAVCGHVFNVFLKFKGGKGVATSVGVLLGVAVLPVFVGIFFFLIIVGITKVVSLGSMVACIVIPFAIFFSGGHYAYVILSACLCVLIVAKHKSNIKRLLSGRERKVFNKK